MAAAAELKDADGSRRQSRRAAVMLLYQEDITGHPMADIVAQHERDADRHTRHHQRNEDRKDEQTRHGLGAQSLTRRCMQRAARRSARRGSQIVYHHCGSPMPGVVTSNR